jgi:hypothetical protein
MFKLIVQCLIAIYEHGSCTLLVNFFFLPFVLGFLQKGLLEKITLEERGGGGGGGNGPKKVAHYKFFF